MMNKETTNIEMTVELIREVCDRYLRRGIAEDVLTRDADVTGGYLLPGEFSAQLINAVNDCGVLRSICTSITTERNTDVPIVNGQGKASWVPDGGQIPLIRDQFDRVTLTGHNLTAIIRVSSELIRDSAIDLEKYLANTFADRLVETEEEAFITGDGMDKPKGLIHQAKAGCETETAGSVSIDDVLNLIFSVPAKHRRNGVLLMNDATLLHLYKLCDEKGPNLWLGKTNDGKDDTFFGMRIARCAAMPEMASGNTPILFGDFKKVLINDQGERGIRRIAELYALNDHVGYLIGERVDIKLTVPDAVKGLKVA